MSFRVIGCLVAVIVVCVVTSTGRGSQPITLTLLSWPKSDGRWVFELIPTYGLATMKKSEMRNFGAETLAHQGIAADTLADLKHRLALYRSGELRVYWTVVPDTVIQLPPQHVVTQVTSFAESRHIPILFKTAGKP
jgi:hypothetical protein